MNILLRTIGMIGCALTVWSEEANPLRIERDFNMDWSFVRTESKDLPGKNAEWKAVNLPHDYTIESDFVTPDTSAEIQKKNLTATEMAVFMGDQSTGYLPGGAAWYKKTFTLPQAGAGKQVQILFDGVYMYSDVYLNGHHLGHHHYGYTAFHYDLTPYLKFGQENEIYVRTDNKLESRWYAGSGIYRPVKLIITDPVHIPIWGTYITTPEVSDAQATVSIETRVQNNRTKRARAVLSTRILDRNGNEVGVAENTVALQQKRDASCKQQVVIKNPERWTLEDPCLYQAVSQLTVDGVPVDDCRTTFGIRTLKFDADKGFFLNGKPTKIRGACLHHDNGLLGAETYEWTEERKILALKEIGFNAIRCAHNPPAVALLDACDKHGILVIDETFDEWRVGKAEGYSPVFDQCWKKDTTSMLLRDRNHPSVIMWSIGNEVPDQATDDGPELAKMLSDYCHQIDPTRPTTLAIQPKRGVAEKGKKGVVNPRMNEFLDSVDIAGINYQNISKRYGLSFDKCHKEFPDRIMYQSESQMANFFHDWMKMIDSPWLLGDFVWTGVDYLGEIFCGRERTEWNSFPVYTARCGDLDITMMRKPRSYYRELVWTPKPEVYVTVHRGLDEGWSKTSWGWDPTVTSWTWDKPLDKEMLVFVYSGCEQAELFLNGKSLGRKWTNRKSKFMGSWNVPYQPGELKAVGYVGGKAVHEQVLKTAGKAELLNVQVDRKQIKANGMDVCYISVEAQDKNGIWHPLANHEVTFEIDGPATIAAVGTSSNLAPVDYPFHGNTCKLHEGQAQLIIRSTEETGTITVKATADGLRANTVHIESL